MTMFTTLCQHCKLRYCLTHAYVLLPSEVLVLSLAKGKLCCRQAEIHGCGAEASKKARYVFAVGVTCSQ